MKKGRVSFTEAYLQRLVKTGKIRSYTVKTDSIKYPVHLPKPKSEAKQITWMREQLVAIVSVLKYKLEEEYRFHETRKWRFDFCLPELKVAIEYEGIQAKKSRHTTLKGYSGDSEKYNEAQAAGWKVFRYTVLTYKKLPVDIWNAIRDHILNTGPHGR